MANIAVVVPAGRMRVSKLEREGQQTSRIPLAIIASKKIGPGAKLVYSTLLSYASSKETATNNRLAADLAVSPRSIRNYIAALKSAGLVKVRLHAGKASSYQLTVAF